MDRLGFRAPRGERSGGDERDREEEFGRNAKKKTKRREGEEERYEPGERGNKKEVGRRMRRGEGKQRANLVLRSVVRYFIIYRNGGAMVP